VKIPNDLTPFEIIGGISSIIRGIPGESLQGKNMYEIPDEIFERIIQEYKDLFNKNNEEKTNTSK